MDVNSLATIVGIIITVVGAVASAFAGLVAFARWAKKQITISLTSHIEEISKRLDNFMDRVGNDVRHIQEDVRANSKDIERIDDDVHQIREDQLEQRRDFNIWRNK